MFGSSSPFGQSASSPFGSQSPFGQTNVAANPFAPKPFGAPNPFGSQTGSSMFGNTSTGTFGQSSSPLSSTPTFGATSSPGFGSSTPAFGNSSSTFGGGSAAFGQKTFGSFGTGTQASPFGASFQQSQPGAGNTMFGSSAPFGASSQPAFGGSSTPTFGSSSTGAFGATSAPAFGATSNPAFGATPNPFGSTGMAFGAASTPGFGSGGAFGSTNASVFGGGSAPGFGATTAPAFGATSSPAFGASSTPTFGASSGPAFGATGSTPSLGGSSTSSFSFGSSPAFGQSTPTFGSTTSPFGVQGSSVGAQGAMANFASGGFGQSNLGGSRVAPYAPTTETDGTSTQPGGKLESISAMLQYKDRSHEELRWEDYQRGDKGGPNAAGQSTPAAAFNATGTAPNPFAPSPANAQSSPSIFNSTQANPFAPKTSPFQTSTPAFPSPFGQTPSLFGTSAAATSSAFGTSPSIFGSNSASSLFPTANAASTGSPSPFGSTPSTATGAFGPGLGIGNTQSTPLFQSSTPSLGQNPSPFGQNPSPFGQNPGAGSLFAPSTGFQTNTFPSTSFSTGNQLSQSSPSLSNMFQLSQPTQTNNLFNFSNTGQTQSGLGAGMFGQSFGQPSANQSPAVLQPVAVTNPFGTLPAMPHMSIGNTGTSSSIQYGISSIPVVDKPAPVRVSSVLTSRHLSQRRIRLPARKYHPNKDGSRVPFFIDEDEAPSTPKADALFIPRENPRALIIRPIDQWPKPSKKDAYILVHENGQTPKENEDYVNGSVTEADNNVANGNGLNKEQSLPVKNSQKTFGGSEDTPNQKGDSYITLSGHRAGEAAIVYEHGADIEATMPKLRHTDYYTEPRIQELAAKERAEPGFCRHVKDFVVGRHGFGSIKFLGETDVRRLDLESLIQFNNREVIVYMDDSKKPPVGQGLNKPAEVTLLNIKCYDKKSGNQILEGTKIERYKEMLKKKAEDQGAEFVSYDPAKGEWKFRVNHFSKYMLSDDDQWYAE